MSEFTEEEILELRREVANLATANNNVNNLRLIRLFNKYRQKRFALENFWYHITTKLPHFEEKKTVYQPSPDSISPNYDVILMPGVNFNWRWQRPQHLAIQWAKHGHRVLFINAEFTPQKNPSYNKRNLYTAYEVIPNLYSIYLKGSREIKPINQCLLQSDIDELSKAFKNICTDFNILQGIVILENPFWTPLALGLRELLNWKVIYDYIDRWYGVHPKAHSVIAEEAFILKEADLIVTTAQILFNEAKCHNDNVSLIPNAADYSHFSSQPTVDPFINLHINRPIIGYCGNIAAWLDIDLIYQIATRHPEWMHILVGSGSANVDILKNLCNVILLGEISYELLNNYVNKFDVCIIPFKLLPVTATTDPVKFYEYLAAGKPVVSTNLPELHLHTDFVYLAENIEKFEDYISTALSEDSVELQQKRREYAKNHSWENRFEKYDCVICDLFLKSIRNDESAIITTNNNFVESLEKPHIRKIYPSIIRVRDPKDNKSIQKITVIGRNFSQDCEILIDEQSVNTDFISPTEMSCDFSMAYLISPGCLMISIINHTTWLQSNRRSLIILGK
jgi:glycosyltransferase involved in cell wall biosynthesis